MSPVLIIKKLGFARERWKGEARYEKQVKRKRERER
jgi:hypothetical protein